MATAMQDAKNVRGDAVAARAHQTCDNNTGTVRYNRHGAGWLDGRAARRLERWGGVGLHGGVGAR
eukprot:1599737-Lingulodinium_polyedra.AAC.1